MGSRRGTRGNRQEREMRIEGWGTVGEGRGGGGKGKGGGWERDGNVGRGMEGG